MEQQFILRLHESIRNTIDLEEAVVDIPDSRSAVLTHGGRKYPGIVVRLPCIVESQKTIDSRQYYKIADISTLVVIYPHSNFDFEREREMHELSGLSAPLKYVKARRFRKRSRKMEYVEEIEKRVNELLEKDMRATRVEITTRDEKELSDELDVLAAEIENKLVENPETTPGEESTTATDQMADEEVGAVVCEEEPRNAEIEALEKSIEEKRRQMEGALNPILQKRFESQLDNLKRELEETKRRLGEG